MAYLNFMPSKIYHIRPILLLILILFLFSCGGYKPVNSVSNNSDQISTYAKSFVNTPYRYGGTSRRGMDCSGLIYHAFLKHGMELPRTTKGLSKFGQKINISDARIGDLLFFKTSKKLGGINHVGLITAVEGDQIQFVHSTSSRGVIITDLNQNYWAKSFKFVRRVM